MIFWKWKTLSRRRHENWIPERDGENTRITARSPPHDTEISEITYRKERSGEISPDQINGRNRIADQGTSGEISHQKSQENDYHDKQDRKEGFETDFLISPADVYPNRKVKLEDADISTKQKYNSKKCAADTQKHFQRITRT